MTAFPEFALDRELRSCVLTRELLQQLEKQIVAAEADLHGATSPAPAQRMNVSVFDASGMESFRSASDIPTSGFPENTEAVRLVTESSTGQPGNDQRSFRCKLAFRSSHGNFLSIRLRGPQARERAIGLYERVRQLTESQLLDAWIFRRRDWLSGLLWLFLFLGGLIWLTQTYALVSSDAADVNRYNYFVFTTALATSGGYLAIVHYFFPKCAFETSKWASVQQWRTWAAQGFAGVLLFDTALFFVGKRMAALMGLLPS